MSDKPIVKNTARGKFTLTKTTIPAGISGKGVAPSLYAEIVTTFRESGLRSVEVEVEGKTSKQIQYGFSSWFHKNRDTKGYDVRMRTRMVDKSLHIYLEAVV